MHTLIGLLINWMVGWNRLKPRKAESESNGAETTPALIGFIGAFLGAVIGAGATLWVGFLQENREATVSRIKAAPALWTHLEFNHTINELPKVVIVNEGPVSATSLIVLAEQCAFTNSSQGGFGILASAKSYASQRSWLTLTNALPGGGAIECLFGRSEFPKATRNLYRVEVRYYPEFNFDRQYTNVAFFGEVNGVIFPELQARRHIPEFSQLAKLFEKGRVD